MHSKLRCVLLLALGWAATGCADAIQVAAPLQPSPGEDLDLSLPAFARVEAPRLTTTAPDGVPPEFEAETSVESAWIMLSITATEARADAFMTYFGSHARQTLNLAVTDGTTTLSATPALSEESSLYPWTRDLRTTSTLPVPKRCGFTAIASSQNEAWHQTVLTFGMFEWGRKNVRKEKQASQEPCPIDDPNSVDPSGGGDGSGVSGGSDWEPPVDNQVTSYTCHWTYWYDPDTGAILEVISVTCVPNY